MSRASRFYAWGEIKDHKRSYGVIVLVIALTMASFMLINASQLYMTQVVSSTTKMTLSSDAVILSPDSDQRDLYGGAREIEDPQQIATKIENELPGYQASVRMTVQASYNVGDGFDGCTIQGIDLEDDPQLGEIKSCVVDGEWFDAEADYLHHHLGTRLDLGDLTEKLKIGDAQLGRISFDVSNPEDEPYPVVIGITATRVHPVEVGDVITLMATKGQERQTTGEQAFTAAVATLKVEVIGLYESAVPTLDQMVWFMPVDCMREVKGFGEINRDEENPSLLSRGLRAFGDMAELPVIKNALNSLLSLAGDATAEDLSVTLHQVAQGLDDAEAEFEVDRGRGEIVIVRAPEPEIRLNEGAHYRKVAEEIGGVIGDSYRIYTASDLISFASGQMWQISSIMNWGMMAVILVLAAFAIYHIMDSIVVRKTREIGSLKAFGATNRTILMVFLYQAFFIGVLAGALGVGVGIGIMRWVNWWGGVTVGFIGGTRLNIGFLTPWYVVLVNFLLPIAVAIGASLIPADRAAKLSPVEALRKGEIGL